MREPDRHVRPAVLEAATRLFHVHGYASVGLRDIAREARVSNGAIHRHFRSKIELAHAVAYFRVLARQRSLDRIRAVHAEPYARLTALVAMLGEEACRDRDSGCPALRLLTHLDRDGDAAERRVSALARRLPRLVGRFVTDELAEAGLTLPDARLMSDAFVTTWQGSVVRILLGEDGELVARELRAWLDHCSNVV